MEAGWGWRGVPERLVSGAQGQPCCCGSHAHLSLTAAGRLAQGQATEAVHVLQTVVEQFSVSGYLDIPVGDGCFSSVALTRLRERQPRISYFGLEIVQSLVDQNLVKTDNNTRLIQAVRASLPGISGHGFSVFPTLQPSCYSGRGIAFSASRPNRLGLLQTDDAACECSSCSQGVPLSPP